MKTISETHITLRDGLLPAIEKGLNKCSHACLNIDGSTLTIISPLYKYLVVHLSRSGYFQLGRALTCHYSVGRNVTTEEASVLSSPRALRVETAGEYTAHTVGAAGGLGLRGNDITLAALRAVAVGLLQFSELELVHDSLVVVDFKT